MTATASVKEFYSGKNIFITGGTGFLGICLLEKILRTIPEHGHIYLLMRPKRGKDISERLEEIKKNQIFETLLKEQSVEQVFPKVSAVAGDVGQEGLGLSPADRKTLTENVNVIFHSAATLDFGDSLKTTVNVNLLGTRRVLELAKECSNLKVLVHVSSAYVNSFKLEVEEEIYDLMHDPEQLISTVEKLSEKELEEQTPEILGAHLNPYTITKHMAEHEVQKAQEAFPCAIVRPSMIVGAWKEPVAGWTISKNGPQGFLMGAAKGVIRRLPVATELVYDYIPVDVVVNALLAAGLHAGLTQTKKVEVYHCTSSSRNQFRWRLIEPGMNDLLHNYPLKSAVWYPHLKFLPSITYYKISALFVHMFPALVLDTVTRIAGGRPILMKLHRNVNSSLDRLEKFIFTEWRFSADKTVELQNWLSKSDQSDFFIDLNDLVWQNYFRDLALGARIYLNKEPLKTLEAAKKKDNILMIVHIVWLAMIVVFMWYIVACVLGMSMTKTVIAAPIVYFLLTCL